MQSENAFKLGSILLLVTFSVAGANVSGTSLKVEKIHSESARVQVGGDGTQNTVQLFQGTSEIQSEVEAVQEINKMNVTEFAPYKIR